MPFLLFYLLIWHLVFLVYPLHVSVAENPHESILIWSVYGMFGVMVAGYFVAGFIDRRLFGLHEAPASTVDAIDRTRVYRFQIAVGLVAAADLLLTIAVSGPPPALSLFGVRTEYYLQYGSGIIGPLPPCLNVLFLTSDIIERRTIRWGVKAVAIFTFILVSERGPLAIMLIQYVTLIAVRYARRWRSFSFAWRAALGTLAGVLALIASMDLGRALRGNLVGGAMAYLRVARPIKHWPLGLIWFAVYLTLPSSNFIWMVDQHLGGAAGIGALDKLIPRLFRGENPLPDQVIPGTIDAASTYFAPMYLAFGWTGLVIEHLIIGVVCYLVSRPNVLRHQTLFGAILASQMVFACFADFFLHLGNIMEYAMVFLFYKVCTLSLQPKVAVSALPAE